jgi:hypothetical protein
VTPAAPHAPLLPPLLLLMMTMVAAAADAWQPTTAPAFQRRTSFRMAKLASSSCAMGPAMTALVGESAGRAAAVGGSAGMPGICGAQWWS